MRKILVIIAKIILIIVGGLEPIEATRKVARETGIDFDTLWDNLPNRWK